MNAVRTRALAALAMLCIVTVAGCRDVDPDQDLDDVQTIPVDDRPEASADVDREIAPELGVDLNAMTRTESGLYIQDLEQGEGEAAQLGRQVEVHYTGWLADGTRFDTSADRGPFEFVLGTGAVIPGWEEGLVGMRTGGRRRLVIPPALAYGRDGYGVIPPYATLVFETHMVEVR
jgi:FKBP-type peptidyl-prolyl cis-trans isomerase FkpA